MYHVLCSSPRLKSIFLTISNVSGLIRKFYVLMENQPFAADFSCFGHSPQHTEQFHKQKHTHLCSPSGQNSICARKEFCESSTFVLRLQIRSSQAEVVTSVRTILSILTQLPNTRSFKELTFKTLGAGQ